MVGEPCVGAVDVGVFHSMHGPMALSEVPISHAVQMAIGEVNRRGGVLGRPVKPYYVDYESSATTAATAARHLVSECGVQYLFGGWMSGARRAILRAIDDFDALLWYPNHYEGFEEARNCIYTGSTVNQLLLPAIDLIVRRGCDRVVLLGADSEFSLTVHAAAKLQLEQASVPVLDEVLIGWDTDLSRASELLAQKQYDAVLCTIQGQLIVDVFEYLEHFSSVLERGRGVVPPLVVMTSMSEVCASRLADKARGLYSVSGFFQSLANAEQQKFIADFKARYGPLRVVSEPMANSYAQLLCWQQLVNDVGSLEPHILRQALPGYRYQGVAGSWEFQTNLHARKPMLLGCFDSHGQVRANEVVTFDMEPDPWLGMVDQASIHGRMIRDLVQSLSERAQHARESQRRADLYARELDELSFVNAHSLREPVRTTLGLLAVLREELSPAASMEIKSTLNMLDGMGSRMSAMSDAMLELSLVGRRDEVQPHDLNHSLETAWQSLSLHAGWRGANLDSVVLPHVLGRQSDFLSMWRQILRNSLDYRDCAKPLVVTVGVEDQCFRWQICVDDNGRGIPLGRQNQCFELFKALGPVGRGGEQHCGAGLAIVRKICQSLGGAVDLATSPAGGVRVVIRIPKRLADKSLEIRPLSFHRFMPAASLDDSVRRWFAQRGALPLVADQAPTFADSELRRVGAGSHARSK